MKNAGRYIHQHGCARPCTFVLPVPAIQIAGIYLPKLSEGVLALLEQGLVQSIEVYDWCRIFAASLLHSSEHLVVTVPPELLKVLLEKAPAQCSHQVALQPAARLLSSSRQHFQIGISGSL